MDGIMLACMESAAFLGGSRIVISYFDYAEKRVLGERPAFIIPPDWVPETGLHCQGVSTQSPAIIPSPGASMGSRVASTS